jgi:hypothetical protein
MALQQKRIVSAVLVLCMVLGGAGSAWLGDSLRAKATYAESLPMPPNAQVVRHLSIGLAPAVAMGYWLKFLSTVGGWMLENRTGVVDLRGIFSSRERVEWMIAYLKGIVEIEPAFPEPYLYAGIVLYWNVNAKSQAAQFLERAWEAGVDKHEVPFYRGVYAFLDNDWDTAATWLERAARHPKAPAIVPLVATMALSRADRAEAGFMLLDSLAESLPSQMEPFRDLIEAEREVGLRLLRLNRAADAYEAQLGVRPYLIPQLVEAGFVTGAEATAPGGGSFFFAGPTVVFRPAERD